MTNRFGFDPLLELARLTPRSRARYWVCVIAKALVAAFVAWLVVGTILSL